MSMFVWDATYSLHIPEIDQQHQRLFALFNELYEAMQQGHGQDVIDEVLAQVLDYTVYHFAHEEQLLRRYGYADQAAHQAEHVQLTEQATTLARKLRAGQIDVTMATLKLLFDWLNHHILDSDKKFAPFLLEQAEHLSQMRSPQPHRQ